MFKNKRSFFERLTGAVDVEEDDSYLYDDVPGQSKEETSSKTDWMEKENEEGELLVDMYQTSDSVIIQAMLAGVHPTDIKVSFSREMVTISGKREAPVNVKKEDYFHHELYWGAFSRTIVLPQEIDPDHVEATEKHGLLTLRLPKFSKELTKEIRVKSVA